MHLRRRRRGGPALPDKPPQCGKQRHHDTGGKFIRILSRRFPELPQPGLKPLLERARLQQHRIGQSVGRQQIRQQCTIHIEPELPPRLLPVGGVVVTGVRRNNVDVARFRIVTLSVDYQNAAAAGHTLQHHLRRAAPGNVVTPVAPGDPGTGDANRRFAVVLARVDDLFLHRSASSKVPEQYNAAFAAFHPPDSGNAQKVYFNAHFISLQTELLRV